MTDTLVQNTPTTIGSWARFIARGLDGAGLDGQQIFLDEGLDLSAVDAPNARFPVDAMSRVWRRAVELTGDEGFALTLADYAVAAPLMYKDACELPLENYKYVAKWFSEIEKLDSWTKTHPQMG